jgi:dihydroneopterin aldolase
MNMKLSITGLSVTTIIGIYPEERTTPQEIVLDIELIFDGSEAAASDNIDHTIDYYQLSETIATFVEKTDYQLLERLISDVEAIIMRDPRTIRCSVTATKPEIVTRAQSISLGTTL